MDSCCLQLPLLLLLKSLKACLRCIAASQAMATPGAPYAAVLQVCCCFWTSSSGRQLAQCAPRCGALHLQALRDVARDRLHPATSSRGRR